MLTLEELVQKVPGPRDAMVAEGQHRRQVRAAADPAGGSRSQTRARRGIADRQEMSPRDSMSSNYLTTFPR